MAAHTAVDSKYIKKIQGKDFVIFEGLLDMAHQSGLKSVETELIQAPHKDNGMLAIVRARVETEKGIFSALGDASPESAERPMQPHIVRLADTRAIARAMRIAVNVGMAATVELAEQNGNGNGSHKSAQQGKNGKVSRSQLTKIWALTKDAGLSTDEMKAHLKKEYNIESSRELTKEQASEVIGYLEKVRANQDF